MIPESRRFGFVCGWSQLGVLVGEIPITCQRRGSPPHVCRTALALPLLGSRSAASKIFICDPRCHRGRLEFFREVEFWLFEKMPIRWSGDRHRLPCSPA